MKRIAIFASGTGTNAEAIFNHFKNNPHIKVTLLVSNKSDAPVITKAKTNNIPVKLIASKAGFQSQEFIDFLLAQKIDLIVLAGFLLLIPVKITDVFKNKIINIHPALLPKYGGKGMYGKHVHDAVLKNHEKESGITIHYVNENFDEGKIIFQAKCVVDVNETPESLRQKVSKLELEYYPKTIEKLLMHEYQH